MTDRYTLIGHCMRLFARGLDADALTFATLHGLSTGDIQTANDWAARAVAMGLSFTKGGV